MSLAIIVKAASPGIQPDQRKNGDTAVVQLEGVDRVRKHGLSVPHP